jgi:2-oxoglutarate/2-oxoacid ferredoxin oxidoreductase subunit alpha
MPLFKNRLSIRFVGESGQGINTLGELTSKALKNSNYFTFGYREYPSLIRGGVASYQIDISSKPIRSASKNCDIIISLDEQAFNYYLDTANEKSIAIYDDIEIEKNDEITKKLKDRNITYKYIPTEEITKQAQGTKIMENVVLLGVLWKILGLDTTPLKDLILETFKNKDIDLDAEIRCIEGGENIDWDIKLEKNISPADSEITNNKIVTGNDALSLGLIAGGLRAYYAYPMTPATSILKMIGDTYKETGIVVKQAESEITAAQMVLGSMHAGTRAATATSGGGFDLMTESISCAGISETPFFVVLAQRAGAGTGVPTWTGASDLRTAISAGHGEFPRCVLSASDPSSVYHLAQVGLNIAEKYQLPVILLTEKQIAESLFSVDSLGQPIPIERGKLSKIETPYKIVGDGISPRPIPSKTDLPFLKTSDEHTEDGVSTEIKEDIEKMNEKRSIKMDTLFKEIPEPKIYGNKDAQKVFVGWGSVKNTILDLIDSHNLNIAYLHYEYIYPLKTEFLTQLSNKGKDIILIENNNSAELGNLIKQECPITFKDMLLKMDGRPIFIEDILEFLEK